MNKNLEWLQEEYIKYPYMTEHDLEVMFTNIKNSKKKHKGINGIISKRDRHRSLRLLKEHIEYILDNE
jgi:hypothetical protein